MPYNDYDINYAPGIFANSFAYWFRIKEYLRVYSVNGIKNELANNHPVALAIPVYNNIEDVKEFIPLPEGDVIGGHAIAIIGFDDGLKAFFIQNSWGKNWGLKGRAWLPYDYVYKSPWFDAWSVRK
jgi:C1A family cysteine protease